MIRAIPRRVHKAGIVRHERNIPRRDGYATFMDEVTCPTCIAAWARFIARYSPG